MDGDVLAGVLIGVALGAGGLYLGYRAARPRIIQSVSNYAQQTILTEAQRANAALVPWAEAILPLVNGAVHAGLDTNLP
jgi:hypothetical protein